MFKEYLKDPCAAMILAVMGAVALVEIVATILGY